MKYLSRPTFIRSFLFGMAVAVPSVLTAFGAHAQSGSHISAHEMEGHCRIAAASQFATSPAYVMIGRPTPSENGGMSIRGTVGGNDTAEQNFTCNYDAEGRFENVSSL